MTIVFSQCVQPAIWAAGDGMTPRTSRLGTAAKSARFADNAEPSSWQQPSTVSDPTAVQTAPQDGFADSQGGCGVSVGSCIRP